VEGRHHSIQEQQHIEKQIYQQEPRSALEGADLDGDAEADVVSPWAERRQLAPYQLEVSVHMRHGTVVLSKPRHAQATFTEAVDDMHDTLKSLLRKEKEKRVDRRRRQLGKKRRRSVYMMDDEQLSAEDERQMFMRA
jgi:ribosome-associated translation inhibitor RaiA